MTGPLQPFSRDNFGDNFSVMNAIGGVRGIIESILPALAFIVLFIATRSLGWTVLLSAILALAELLVRLIQKQSALSALSGLIVVAVCLLSAWLSKDARNFYFPGFVINAVCLLILLVSLAVKVPALGFLIELGRGQVKKEKGLPAFSVWLDSWNNDRGLHKAYVRATLVWTGLFLIRLLTEVPLYFLSALGALGAARLVLGIPFFALALWITWLVLADDLHRTKLQRQQAFEEAQAAGIPDENDSK